MELLVAVIQVIITWARNCKLLTGASGMGNNAGRTEVVHASHPAAPGSNPGSAEIFSAAHFVDSF